MDRSKQLALRLTVVLLVFSWKLSVAFLLDLRTTSENKRISSSFGNLRHRTFHHESSNNGQATNVNKNNNDLTTAASRVTRISSRNLGGVTDVNGQTVHVELPLSSVFSVCTGDSGVGKSLLLARAAELLSGSKTPPKVLGLEPSPLRNQVEVEMEFQLTGAHATHVQQVLLEHGMLMDILGDVNGENDSNNDKLMQMEEGTRIRLQCKRTITLHEPPSDAENPRMYRLKSHCELNGHPVPLSVLSSIVAPLVAIVDGTKAALALARPHVRTSMLDRMPVVDAKARLACAAQREAYQRARDEREALHAQLDNRILPQGYSSNNSNEEDAKLLSHWILELDSFESRVMQLCKSFGLVEDDADDDNEPRRPASSSQGMSAAFHELALSNWMDNDSSDPRFFHSSVHRQLCSVREAIRSLDGQHQAAHNALNALTSLSSTESTLTALERSRSFVEEASSRGPYGGNDDDDRLVNAAETCHDLLNEVEEAVKRCARYLEEDRNGLLQTLEDERAQLPVTVEQLDELLLEWGTLARKHGVPTLSLPSCHQALKQEQAGNEEFLTRFPQLVECEERHFANYVEACRRLSTLRNKAAEQLTTAVNNRLPALGMKPRFQATVHSHRYGDPDQLLAHGADDVRFLLQKPSTAAGSFSAAATDVHAIASSGEMARILLAMECSIPGSIAAACTRDASKTVDNGERRPPPILVLYDEIDAHMGGHASTALAMMLAEQASHTSQILAITHNPAVAALADHHIVVQKSSHATNTVMVQGVWGRERTQELARMASGNLAMEEAEAFANALIRDGANMRNLTESEELSKRC